MNNPKTTLAGYATLAASLLVVVAHVLEGQFTLGDLYAVVTAIGGIGLIVAQDGGH